MKSKHVIFKQIFGKLWDKLPTVMKKHYANRAYTTDEVVATGTMKVEISLYAKLLSPLMKLFGALVPITGDHIPTTVTYRSNKDNSNFELDRVLNFPNGLSYQFQSYLEPQRENEVVETMRSGIGWHAAYEYDGKRVFIIHKGYKVHLFGRRISLPLVFLLGRGFAFEEAIDEDTFSMYMEIVHPLFGRVYSYSGQFKITKVEYND